MNIPKKEKEKEKSDYFSQPNRPYKTTQVVDSFVQVSRFGVAH